MNTYLIITHRNEFSQYITKQKCFEDALVKFYDYSNKYHRLSVEEFKLLVLNKTSDEAINLFNRFSNDNIEFFGIIHQPFINNLKDIDKENNND